MMVKRHAGLADAFLPEAAVLDIRMPGKDGFAVAECLRRMPCVHSGCLIAVSGETAYSLARFTTMAAFDHFLTKPASPYDIAAILASCSV